MRSLRSYWYNFHQSVTKLFEWMPIAWRDRDWDGDFVYIVLLRKIRSMEKHNENYDIYVGQAKQYIELHMCRVILERIINRNYLSEELALVEEKYGKFYFDFRECEIPGCKKLITCWASEEHEIAWENASKKALEREAKDKEDLWNMLNDRLDAWWT